MVKAETAVPAPNAWYDELMFKPLYLDFYEQGGFANYGYWDAETKGPHQAGKNLVRQLLDRMSDKSGRILDVACGKGETTRQLLDYYAPEQIVAINISERQLEAGRQLVPGAEFRCMDATRLEFDDASFENLMCVEAAFHFDTRAEFLAEALRVLKPGGTLALSDILMTREAERARPYRTEANYLSGPEEYAALLTSVGFRNVRIDDVTERCWYPFFRYTVNFLHERFLRREIDEQALKNHLSTNYGHVNDLESYLLVSAQK